MAKRGRPTSVAAMLERLKAAPSTKERVLVLLSNLAGTMPVAEACRKLALGRTHFWSLRTALLEASIRAVEPRRRGRPIRMPTIHAGKIAELQAEIDRLKEALELARVREEIALLLPWTGRRQKRTRKIRRPRQGAMPSPSRVG